MTNTNLALSSTKNLNESVVENRNPHPANDNHDFELSSDSEKELFNSWESSEADGKTPANDNGDDPKTPNDNLSTINFSEELAKCKELVKNLDNKLKEKGLTEEEFQKVFDKGYIAASDFLKRELELAKAIKELPTMRGFRTDKVEGPIYTKGRYIEERFKISPRTAYHISNLTPECVERALAYAKEYKEIPTTRLALLLLKQDDIKTLHQEVVKAKEEQKALKKKRKEERDAQKLQEDIENFNAIQNPLPNLASASQYNIIYADPSVTEYSQDDLKQIVIPASDNSVLFLWSPVSKLKEMIELLEIWGFSYKESAVWDRMDNSHPGKYFKNYHDILLVAEKGSGVEAGMSEKSVCRIQLKDGETKPEYYKAILANMFPGKVYLDLFPQTTTTDAE